MMTIQDERYLNYKRQIERKKIEKLRNSLHLIDAETGAQRKHTFFVDKKVSEVLKVCREKYDCEQGFLS